MNVAEIIAASAREPALPFLIIGGHAVMAHGYPRTTVDLDFLTRKSDRAGWKRFLISLGYAVLSEQQAFIQFTPPAGGIEVDLMVVSDTTFDQMLAAAQDAGLPGPAKVPSLEHLLALKLHVLKQKQPHRIAADMDDVINLVLANHLDLRSERWRQHFAKYGTLELYERILHATADHNPYDS